MCKSNVVHALVHEWIAVTFWLNCSILKYTPIKSAYLPLMPCLPCSHRDLQPFCGTSFLFVPTPRHLAERLHCMPTASEGHDTSGLHKARTKAKGISSLVSGGAPTETTDGGLPRTCSAGLWTRSPTLTRLRKACRRMWLAICVITCRWVKASRAHDSQWWPKMSKHSPNNRVYRPPASPAMGWY